MASSETPLYAQLRDAVFDNDRVRLQELLQHDGVDVDHLDAGGQTLLHLASFWGRMELVKVLLHAGASLKAKNAAACTALDLATHWGHSAVAEVLRLRGGRSVWEDKFGHVQMQLEDLTLELQQAHAQSIATKRDFDALTVEYNSLYTQLEEAKSAQLLAEHALALAQRTAETLAADNTQLQTALDAMTAAHDAALIDTARAEHLQREAQRETAAALAHRDDILHTMRESIDKQAAAALGWQRAEVAAAVAESQRSFALAARDQWQRKHTAALAELVVVTARLDAAEDELMAFKTDFAEHIYEQQREQKLQRRAARAISPVHGPHDNGATSATSTGPDRRTSMASSLPLTSNTHRPLTTPVGTTSLSVQHHRAEQRHATPATRLPTPTPTPRTNTVVTSTSRNNSTTDMDTPRRATTKYFSLAAREFGERLRADERRKHAVRAARHARTQSQYVAATQSGHIRPADAFQSEFVTAVQTFAAARSATWTALQTDRDRQLWFTRSVLARSVATAPHAVNGSSSIDSNSSVDSIAEPRGSGSSTADSTVRLGIYHKYARPVSLDCPLRPVTSPLKERMQQSFFATSATAATAVATVDVGARSEQTSGQHVEADDASAPTRTMLQLPAVVQ